jgi:hypothetical protein
VSSWADIPYARAMWPDAPKVDTTLQSYLDAAHTGVVEYAPELPVTDPPTEIPESYKLAEVLHARALWTATRRDGDVLGFDDGSAVRVRPLDNTVKGLLRPPSPSKGRVG